MNESVKKFYNNNPYPNVFRLKKYSLPKYFFESACKEVNKPIPEKPEILILGCGTIAPMALAKLYPDAKIICAVDISDNTIKIAKKHCPNNISEKIIWVNADLSNDNMLDKLPTNKFDWIHCTGVLHHIEEPEKAIKNLSILLKDEGIIRFQVYSKGARTWIEWARSTFLSKNATNTNDVKEILVALSRFHPFRYVLATYPESLNEAGLKDGFLHPLVKTFYGNEWNKLFNNNDLQISKWENLHYLEDLHHFLPSKAIEKFNLLPIENKIAFLEKIGEWRSDFKGILTKEKTNITSIIQAKKRPTNLIIDDSTKYSYPRYYLWQEFKSAIKDLDCDLSKDDISFIIKNLSQREWLSGITGLKLRFKWSSWRKECKKFASHNIIFAEKEKELIEDYFSNQEAEIYIPSPDTWAWEQRDNGFFAWEWD